MLAIFRIIFLFFSFFLICLFGIFNCIVRPKCLQHTFLLGKLFGRLSKILGVKVIVRISKKSKELMKLPSIYIGNHQSFYDIFTISNAIQPYTVTVGKKNLIFIPIFGQLYWLCGNVLLDRKNRDQIRKSILKIIRYIRNQGRSVWIFPEGTRNKGKNLLPFKNGAFRIAKISRVPIIPICSSEISRKIRLNRWRNGTVIIEILDPIFIEDQKHDKRSLTCLKKFCFNIMKKKIFSLNQEIKKSN
ncbi:1-acylglycerol-3-phosphate O-acyltransferase [Candidatus Riesia pediculicola]|uniref:1-acylglycerol-3-phosphate O-acyltransferase n=1 Tax=Candidatus Riesia pediculicola TaxID=401619 RepID=UPI0009C3529D|nr:acyl-phosphate glycerol 3-phosphate acyltransferase [Candidatus Riesia pediculicola]